MAEAKLTVLQLLPAMESGGVERGTLEVAQALVDHGCRAMVMSAGGRLTMPLEACGAEHYTWPVGIKSFKTLGLVHPLRRFLLEHQVDIVHARSRVPAWIAWLAWRGMPALTRPRFVTTVHGLYGINKYSRIMARGERIIAVSNTVHDYILQAWPDTSPDRITVIPRGVEAHQYPFGYQPDAAWQHSFQQAFPIAGKLLLTLPGRITRLKGHEDFIEIVRRLKKRGLPVYGLIVGGATASKQRYMHKLRYRISTLGLEEDIGFTGQRDDLKNILAISNLVLSLSTQPESFGRTTLEALRLGVPTAGYAHGGVGEILRTIYPTGLLERDEMDATVNRIANLLQQPVSVPQGDFYPLQAMLEDTLDLYKNLFLAPRNASGIARTRRASA
ncbi:MAG: glycosyltransferase [Thiobacillus sp.]